MGLKFREMERVVFAPFLHSQPIGQSAQTPELVVLADTFRDIKIGTNRWTAVGIRGRLVRMTLSASPTFDGEDIESAPPGS